MAKFGLFRPGLDQPLQQYEGDRMKQNGDHVYIYVEHRGDADEQVAAIKLDAGYSVKKIG